MVGQKETITQELVKRFEKAVDPIITNDTLPLTSMRALESLGLGAQDVYAALFKAVIGEICAKQNADLII